MQSSAPCDVELQSTHLSQQKVSHEISIWFFGNTLRSTLMSVQVMTCRSTLMSDRCAGLHDRSTLISMSR